MAYLKNQTAAANGSRGSGLAKDLPVGATFSDVTQARANQNEVVQRKSEPIFKEYEDQNSRRTEQVPLPFESDFPLQPELATEQQSAEGTPVNRLSRSGRKNVLSSYRSYTYNFTLAALTQSQVDEPESYTNSETLDLIVLSSKGKSQNQSGTSGDFNQNSPGRFNMYIDNVTIDSIMSYVPSGNATLPTTIKFDVFEPYSINGFLEALQATALAAGFRSYAECPYVLLVEFIGYPDGKGTPDPVRLQEKRYFTIGFAAMEVNLTEKGTHYNVTAYAYNERGFAAIGRLNETVTVRNQGATVEEILKALVKNYTEQLVKQIKEQKGNEALHDEYEIRFDGGSSISESKVLEIGKNNSNISFIAPEEGTNGARYVAPPQSDTPWQDGQTKISDPPAVSSGTEKAQTITFAGGTNIYDAISTIIVNSVYIRRIVKDLYENGLQTIMPSGSKGLVPYFLVKVETKHLDKRDETNNRILKKYTFVVSPFMIHYSRIPGVKFSQAVTELETLSSRSYNYLYTGKNTDIINFKLNYNVLFMEGLPRSNAVNDQVNTVNAAGTQDVTQPKKENEDANKAANEEIAKENKATAFTLNRNSAGDGYTDPKVSILQQGDPYFALANNLHQAIINSSVALMVADVDILGDPFFLVTGGIGGQTEKDDEAARISGDVFIDIKFRNPDDIGDDGFLHFDPRKAPFEGVYRITLITNTFKEGKFLQHLSLIRIPTQTDSEIKGQAFTGTEKPEDKGTEDSGEAGTSSNSNGATVDTEALSTPLSPATQSALNEAKARYDAGTPSGTVFTTGVR